MPRIAGKHTQVYLGGYELTGKTREVSLDYGAEDKDATVFGVDTVLSYPGLLTAKANVVGLMDVGPLADGNMDAIIDNRVGSVADVPFTVVLGTATPPAEGDRAVFFRSFNIKGGAIIGGAVGDLHPFEVSCDMAAGELRAGVCALPDISRSGATGNSTGVDLGAGVLAGEALFAALHVFDVSAGGSVVVTVESDVDALFASPTTQITFTAATGITSEVKSKAGAVTDEFWRVTWTRTGGATFRAAVVLGIGRA
jgi:hypothetical protein